MDNKQYVNVGVGIIDRCDFFCCGRERDMETETEGVSGRQRAIGKIKTNTEV